MIETKGFITYVLAFDPHRLHIIPVGAKPDERVTKAWTTCGIALLVNSRLNSSTWSPEECYFIWNMPKWRLQEILNSILSHNPDSLSTSEARRWPVRTSVSTSCENTTASSRRTNIPLNQPFLSKSSFLPSFDPSISIACALFHFPSFHTSSYNSWSVLWARQCLNSFRNLQFLLISIDFWYLSAEILCLSSSEITRTVSVVCLHFLS